MISSANPSLRQEMKIVAMVEVEAGHSEKTSGVMWADFGGCWNNLDFDLVDINPQIVESWAEFVF